MFSVFFFEATSVKGGGTFSGWGEELPTFDAFDDGVRDERGKTSGSPLVIISITGGGKSKAAGGAAVDSIICGCGSVVSASSEDMAEE